MKVDESMSHGIEFDGERFIPDQAHGDIELEHLHRYLLASELAAGKIILDIASGAGYGSAMLARQADHVIGVDISEDAVSYASLKYKLKNLEFRLGSCSAMPVANASIDLVVSFETIEHHAEHEAMMAEIKRVLRPDGFLIISCPDKYEYSDKPNYRNEFHVKELYRDEFRNLLKGYFKKHSIYGQRVVYGSLVLSEEGLGDIGSYDIGDSQLPVISGTPHAVYLIAVASDAAPPRLKSGIFQQPVGDSGVVKELGSHIERLEGAIDNLNATLSSLVTDRDSQKAGLAQLQDAITQISQERDEQVSQLNHVVAEREGQIANLGQTVESLVIDRDSQKAGLAQLQDAITQISQERDEQVSQLNHVVAEREGQIENMNMELSAMYNSKSWRLTSPLRKLVWWSSKLIALPSRRRQNVQIPASTSLSLPDVPCSISVSEEASAKENAFRILLVSHYCPTRAHAGGLRILDIYALIRKQCPSVQLDLLTHHRPTIDCSLVETYQTFHNVYLSPVEDLTPATLAALRGAPLTYDVVDLQFHQAGHYIDEFKHIGGKIIFTPMESATKVLFLDLRTNFNLSKFLPLRKFAASMRAAAEEVVFTQKVDEVVCVSRADAAFLRAVTSSRRICGIDTGVSQFEFKEELAPDYETPTATSKSVSVLYVAYFGSETNVRALLWYLEHVHPLVKARVPDYVLTVVGRGDLSPFSKYRDKSIEFVGEVPAIAPYIKEARVGIAPALGGAGFRGKVNQYAVLGCPCVVSPVAFKGLSYQDGVSIFIAETPKAFADRCIQLLTDLEFNERMGKAARQLCIARYSWLSKWAAIRKIYKLEGVE